MILRIIGSLFILSGCLGLGYWYSEQFHLRLEDLHMLETILDMMMSEVRYGKAPLPECCFKISKRLGEPYGQAFSKIYEETSEEKGRNFCSVFENEMRKCMEGTALKQEEKTVFLQAVPGNGFEENGMQIKHMEQSRERLHILTKRLESELSEKSGMALGLGIMSGLLLTILFF